MINGNDELNLEYLLDPCFQIVNTHGAPLTSGWLEVYIHGTRTKYYCASDFDGTLHPFKIPLDSLGSNIVLADPSQAYDVYVYNKYGTLQMSRYNVKPGSGGSGSGQIVIDDKPISRIQVVSNTLDATEWNGTPWKYALFEVVGDKLTWRQDGDDPNLGNVYAKAGTYHYDFIVRVDWNGELRNEICRFQILGINSNDRDTWHSFDLSYPHTEFYHFSSFSNRMAGYEDRIFVDLDISPYGNLPTGLTATVETLTIFSIEDSVSVHTGLDKVHHDETMTGDGTSSNPLSISEEVSDLQDQIDGKQDKLIPGEGISIDENNVITCSAQGGGGGPTYTAGQYIDITPENVINVSGLQPAGDYLTPEDLEGYATQEDIDRATSGKLDASAYTAPVQSDWNQTNSSALDYIKNKPTIPSLDGYATEQYVIEQTSGKLDASDYTAPVNADWNSEGGLSEILNKPDVAGLIPGQGIEFTPSGDNYVVNCTSSGDVSKQYVDQAILSATSGKLNTSDYTAPVQSDWNQNDSEALDFIKNKPTIPSLDGYATEEYVIEQTSGKLDASDYTAPEQSDWNEADSDDLAYIKNKPVEIGFIAGEGIRFEDLSSAIRISCSAQGGNYTAGDGIAINSGTISVNIGKNLAFESPKEWVELDAPRSQTGPSSYGFSLLGQLDANKVAALKNGQVNFKPNFDYTTSYSNLDHHFAICKKNSYNQPNNAYCIGSTQTISLDGSTVLKANETYVLDFSSVDASSTTTWSAIEADPTSYYLAAICWYSNQGISSWTGKAAANNATGHPGQIEVADPSAPKVLYAVDQAGGGSSYTPGTGIDITNNVISVNSAVAMKSDIPAAQVQSDWTEDDTEDPAFIKNKPSEYELIAGAGVSITPSGTNYIISSTGGGGGSTYTAGDGIDITGDVISVTSAVAKKTDLATLATKTEVQAVSYQNKILSYGASVSMSQLYEYLNLNPYLGQNLMVKISDSDLPTAIVNKLGGQSEPVFAHYTHATKVESSGRKQTICFEAPITVNNYNYTGSTQYPQSYIVQILATEGSSYSGPVTWSVSYKELKADSDVFWVTLTYSSNTWTGDKTLDELQQAKDSGKLILLKYNEPGYYPSSGTPGFGSYGRVYTPSKWSGSNIYDSTNIFCSVYIDYNYYESTTYKPKMHILQANGNSSGNVTFRDILGAPMELAKASDLPDMSTYATKQYVASQVSGKQDQLTFTYDSNDDIIGINGSGIGGTGGGGSSYTAGTGIDITNDVISVDQSVIPSKSDLEGYVPYDASGVNLPNSHFEINASGQAYKVGFDTKTDITDQFSRHTSDFELLRGLPAGTYEFHIISTPAASYIKSEGRGDPLPGLTDGIPVVNGVATWVLTQNITPGNWQSIGVYDSSDNFVDEAYTSTVWRVTPGTKSEYALKSDIPDTSDMATKTWVGQQGFLTSIPSSYATDTEVSNAVAAGTSGKQNKLTSVTDVQLVNALPGSPVSTVLYLIPEA